MTKELRQIISSIKSYIELESQSGITEYFFNQNKWKRPAQDAMADDLENLRKEVSNCTRCDLYKRRRNVVFGSGDPHASLMFIGEAPGEEEDIQALPFVGRAGQLLTK